MINDCVIVSERIHTRLTVYIIITDLTFLGELGVI